MTSAMSIDAGRLPGGERRPGLRSVPPEPRRRRTAGASARALPTIPATAVPAVREGACRPGTGCAGTSWLVTAPQQQPRSVSADRAPWGTYHLKENGGLLTLCGEYAVTWYVFWGFEVNPLAREACRGCLRVMRGRVIDVTLYPRTGSDPGE